MKSCSIDGLQQSKTAGKSKKSKKKIWSRMKESFFGKGRGELGGVKVVSRTVIHS